MKGIKALGLAAFVGMAAAAIGGVGVASADTLCKANETPCAAANRYPESTKLTRKEAVEFCLVGCAQAKVVWKESTSKNNGPHVGLAGSIESASFTEVKGECKEASAVNLPWASEWSATSQRLLFASGGKGNPGLLLKGCTGFNLECRYGTTSSLWAITGGNPLKLHELPDTWSKTGGSALCPETGTWASEGELIEPTGLVHLVALP